MHRMISSSSLVVLFGSFVLAAAAEEQEEGDAAAAAGTAAVEAQVLVDTGLYVGGPAVTPSGASFTGGALGPEQVAPPEGARAVGKLRGGWSDIYRRVAPSVVLLAGHGPSAGSGFLVDREGWLVTNWHVVSDGYWFDAERDMYMHVFLGDWDRKLGMKLRDQPERAYLLDFDPIHDLALLRLEGGAEIVESLGTELIDLSDSDPTPGQEVAALGHAGVGFLWSIKPGHVTAVGQRTEDTVNLALEFEGRLEEAGRDATSEESQRLMAFVRQLFASHLTDTLYVQATAEIAQGDSGGPLFDAEGRLVGVNVQQQRDLADVLTVLTVNEDGDAVPLPLATSTGSAGYYFVHRDMVEQFLVDRPGARIQAIPRDIWDPRTMDWGMEDVDLPSCPGDGIADMAVGYSIPADPGNEADRSGFETLLAFDLDGNNGVGPVLSKPEMSLMPSFDAEFAVVGGGGKRAFVLYDLDGVDGFEVVLEDLGNDGSMDTRCELQGDRFDVNPVASGAYFLDAGELPEAWRERYQALVDLVSPDLVDGFNPTARKP